MAVNDKRDRQLDAERGVIGSLLIEPDILRELLALVREEDFLNPVNRLIFQAARTLFRAGKPVDAMTLRGQVGEQYSNYLVQMVEITPTAANWREYTRLMHEQAAVQRGRSLADKLSLAVTLEDLRPVAAQLGQLLSDGRKLNAWTVPELQESFFQSQDPDAPPPEYVTCGLRFVDEGAYIEPGDVVMLGGYPSDGKTGLALQMAWHMAERYKVGFFSLETDRRKLRDRLIAGAAQVDFSDIKRWTLRDEDWKALAEKSAAFSRRDLTLVEAAGMTAAEIEAASQAYGFQVIFIDYIQLVTPERTAGTNRSEQMAGVSRALHTFAQRSGTLVVELAQLTRQERGEKLREPTMHDLKESGQFEQDADLIFLLFRPNPGKGDLDPEQHRILKIGKNKEGRQGKWPLYFDGGKQTFSVMTDGKRVLRSLADAGRKARIRSRERNDPGQVEFTELAGEDQDIPF